MLFLVQAAINANTFIFDGAVQKKELTELAPGIIEQLSPESLDRLRKMANAYLQMSKNGTGNISEAEIPKLIEDFEKQTISENS